MGTDWEAWEPEEPPRDFAERVVGAAIAEKKRARSGRAYARYAAAAAIVLAIGGGTFAARRLAGGAVHGEADARVRTQIAIGDRAVAVLDPGAHVSWDGDRVTQTSGNVFYRVEPGGGFRVRTQSGEVEVKGTCFRVKVREESAMNAHDLKVGAVGALVGAATFVGVYEGKVALTHAKANVEIGPGESARADASGARRSGSIADGERDFDANKPASSPDDDDPALAANKSLAGSVRTYKQRLEAIESEKAKLKKDLDDAQQKLALATDASAASSSKKSEFDLNDDDWKGLAKQGEVKVRYPCGQPSAWNYSPKQLNKLGLAPQDGPPIAGALGASYKRSWGIIKPLCAQALGGAPEVAEKVGEQACINIVMDLERQKPGVDVDEQVRQVAEIRAGILPAPSPEAQSPVMRMLLALSYEAKNIESDLSKSIGPDDAHRVAFDGEGCWSNQGIGVGPRKPAGE